MNKMNLGLWLTRAGVVSALLGGCSGKTVIGTGTGGTDGVVGAAGGMIAAGGQGGGSVSNNAGAGGAVTSAGGFAGLPEPALGNVEAQKQSDKLDVLFVLDNSIGMAQKQSILAKSAQAFVSRLVNPRCVDAQGNPVTAQPASGAEKCSSGTREFTPVIDMHLGAITTSLGSHGGAVCATSQGADDHLDDKGQLLASLRTGVTTYNDSGFLSLDSSGKAGVADSAIVSDQLSALITAAGEHGCGYEATLESMYRFLVDPAPPASVELQNQTSTPTGLNRDLLDQRAAFLRPDSSVAVVILSDENDCSIRDDGVGWFVGSSTRMPRSTVECATDPNSPCCRSCATSQTDLPPSGCGALAEDANCALPVVLTQSYSTWDAAHDSLNLRCYEQKQRFGFDLLYELERYTTALTNYSINDRDGNLVDNPLFAARDGKPQRSNSLISVSLMVGAPWQDLATKDSLSTNNLTYLSESQLESNDRWPMLIGDAEFDAPSDPLMLESTDPRSGKSPLTGASLIAADSTDPLANPANGHEQFVPDNDELQYACTFQLPKPEVCAAADATCACAPDKTGSIDAVLAANSPVCQPPAGGPPNTTQYFGKAYPGARELRFGKALGERTAAASICPKDTSDETSQNYGYVPALNALVDRIAVTLK